MLWMGPPYNQSKLMNRPTSNSHNFCLSVLDDFTEEQFSLRGHLAMSGDIFAVMAGDGGGGALGIEWVETRMLLSIQK